MATPHEVQDEERRARRVRIIVNFTSNVIMQGSMSRVEGEALVAAARARILDLFPGQEETYEIVLSRRFARLLEEFTRPERGARAATILRFPARSV